MGSTRYIMSIGELTRKDNSLCFRKNGRNVYIPVENTKEIYCFNEVGINTKLLDFLSQNHIIIHFFNYYGGYSGTYYPKSVFRGEMTPSKFIQLRKDLNQVIDKDEDFICIIKLMNDNVFGEEVLGNGGEVTGESLMI